MSYFTGLCKFAWWGIIGHPKVVSVKIDCPHVSGKPTTAIEKATLWLHPVGASEAELRGSLIAQIKLIASEAETIADEFLAARKEGIKAEIHNPGVADRKLDLAARAAAIRKQLEELEK